MILCFFIAGIVFNDLLPSSLGSFKISAFFSFECGEVLLWNGLCNIGSAHSNPTGYAHLPSSLQQILDNRGNLFLSSYTLEERDRTRADKSDRCRKHLHLECLCDSRGLLNIDLNKLEGTRLFTCELFEGSQQLF